MIKKIGDILREYLADKGWPADDPRSPVFLRWTEIAGEELGRHSRPVEIEDGILFVEADHPGWVQMISLQKTRLMKALAAEVPEAKIRDLRVRMQRPRH